MTEEDDLGFLQHLDALRKHLIRAALILTMGFAVAYIFHKAILDVLVSPVMAGLRNHGIYELQTISIAEGIMTYIKSALVAGIVLSMPLILREVWLFISPGMYPNEKKVVMPAFFVMFLFFLAGIMFSYFFFVPFVVDFLASMTPGQALLVPRLSEVFSLSLMFYLVFGLVFEVPLIMFILSFLGVFNTHQYLKALKYFVVASFVIAALFTPPDPLSQVLLAVPLCLLYGLGILASLASGKAGGVVSALRVLGGMAFLLIIFTAAGYFIAKNAKTNWITSPAGLVSTGECLQYLDLNTLHIRECKGAKTGYFIRLFGPKRKITVLKTSKCPEGTSIDKGLCLCNTQRPPKWMHRLRPTTPAGLWCKNKNQTLSLTAKPLDAGLDFVFHGSKKALRTVENALPGKDWPRTVRQDKNDYTMEFWLPRAGIRGFLDKVFIGAAKTFQNQPVPGS